MTAQNLAAVLLLFSAAGRSGAENIKEGALLCSKGRQWRGQNGKADPTWLPPCCSEAEQASLVDLLVGQGVSKVFADRSGARIFDGTIERVTSRQPVIENGNLVVDASIEYEAVYASAPGGRVTVTYTQKEAQGAHELYLAVQAREAEVRRLERDAAGDAVCSDAKAGASPGWRHGPGALEQGQPS